jgi:streptogramin lyase
VRRVGLTLALSLAAALATAPAAFGAVGGVTEFSTGMPTGGAPQSITAGPDGDLWFTLPGANAIGRITPTGQVSSFTAGIQTGAQPWGITAGPDGNLWFTERGTGAIGRITPQGQVTEFAIPTSGMRPWGITAGPDGNLWFTAAQAPANPGDPIATMVGRITPQGVVTEFTYALGNTLQPRGITAGPDGNLWVVQSAPVLPEAGSGQGSIVQMTTQGTVLSTFTTGITVGAGLYAIIAGPDGNLWFTEQTGNRVGRITPAGVVSEYGIAAAAMSPAGIVAGADGALWVTENGTANAGNNVVRVTTAGAMTQYQNGISANAGLIGIAAGPDGNLWFTESNGNRIGRLLSGVEPVVTAAPQLSGAPVIGTALSVTTGTWRYLPTSYRYRWLRCTTAAATKCSTVSGQSKATYAITNADQGQFLRASVVAVNLNGTSAGAPTQVSAQVPTSAFTVTKPTITYQERAVLLTSTVTTSWAGPITQVGTTTQSGRTVQRCLVEQRVAGGGMAQIVCRLPYASRRTLRYTSLSMTITTTFQATDGPLVTKTQSLRVPARLYPWRPI